MKKKLVLVIIVAIVGIILFLENVCKISVFNNMKQIIVGQSQMTDNGENNSTEYTVIDVTNLKNNGNIQHDHILKTVYDENEHWSECTVCGEKTNIKSHTYATTWASGIESCEKNNYYTKTCTCGYSYTGHKPCVWVEGTYKTERGYDSYAHIRLCSNCNGYIMYSYKKKAEVDKKGYELAPLYSADYTINAMKKTDGSWYETLGYQELGYQRCTSKDNGSILTCNNLGVCSVCKTNISKQFHKLEVNDNNEIYCIVCNKKYGTYVQTIEEISTAPATYKIKDRVNLTNGAIFLRLGKAREVGNPFTTNSMTASDYIPGQKEYTSYTLNTIVTFKSSWKVPYGCYTSSEVTINGVDCYLFHKFIISPDNIKPTNIKIEVQNEWTRTKPITILGTENYCNTVSIKILDENGEIVFEGGGKVSSKKFSVSCVPELEIDTNGKTFTAIITDACENSVTQEFSIAKADAKAPVVTSGSDITGEWTKSRKFTFKAIDKGIGEVSISFNGNKDYSLASFDGTEYCRNYEFIGDVYSPKELSVLYKDGLGNTSIQKVTIDKIDNTSPTIVSAAVHNNIININANDNHTLLGKGSGVVKYRYITSAEKLDNPIVSSGIEVDIDKKMVIGDIYKVKYIYIVAEDLVGNVSDVYEVKVPELILTSKVDLNLADGRGGIILDWSTYDITDKYFVIYRKKENETEWEKIVTLNEKLTGNMYRDIFANDRKQPSIPKIDVSGDDENNNIKVDVSSEDEGSIYTYYIEAYDNNGNILNKSNIV